MTHEKVITLCPTVDKIDLRGAINDASYLSKVLAEYLFHKERIGEWGRIYDWMCDIDIFRRMLEDCHNEFYWSFSKGNYETTNTRLEYDYYDENCYLIKWIKWDSVGDKEHSACFLVERLSDERD